LSTSPVAPPFSPTVPRAANSPGRITTTPAALNFELDDDDDDDSIPDLIGDNESTDDEYSVPNLIDDNESIDDDDSIPDLIGDNESTDDEDNQLTSPPLPPSGLHCKAVKHRIVADGHFVDDVTYTVCSESADASDEDDDDEDAASFDLYVENFRASITPNVMAYLHIDWIENLYDSQYIDSEVFVDKALACALNRTVPGDDIKFCTKCRQGLKGHFCNVPMRAGSGTDQLRRSQDGDPDVAPKVLASSKFYII